MLKIINEQSETVRIDSDGASMIVYPNSICEIPLNSGSFLKFSHDCFFEGETTSYLNKTISKFAKSAVLIIDTTYQIFELNETSIIKINNGVCEFKSEDFGYLYFDVTPVDCKIDLLSCEIVNKKSLLNMHKIMRLGEWDDFPPFTTLSAIYKYFKVKKLCQTEEVFKFLKKQKDRGRLA